MQAASGDEEDGELDGGGDEEEGDDGGERVCLRAALGDHCVAISFRSDD